MNAQTPREWIIYILLDPRDRAIRYVGWTFNLKARLQSHMAPSRLNNHHTPRDRWLRCLREKDLRPLAEVVERSIAANWSEAERRWISHFRNAGITLTNLTPGGEGMPGPKSAETCRRISEGKLRAGTKRPDVIERNKRTAGSLRGKKLNITSDERLRRRKQCKEMSAKGHWLQRVGPEERAAFAEQQRGKTLNTWVGEKAEKRRGESSDRMKAVGVTEENLNRLRLARLLIPAPSEATRKKISESMRQHFAKMRSAE